MPQSQQRDLTIYLGTHKTSRLKRTISKDKEGLIT